MTGVTILESRVELISPPIMTIASGDISGFVDIAMGIRPPIAVREVRIMGRNLISEALRIASSSGVPSSLIWFVKSTSSMVFLTSIPARAISPMIATKETELPVSYTHLTLPTILRV